MWMATNGEEVRKNRTLVRAVEVVDDVICDSCQKSTEGFGGGWWEFATLKFSFGYGPWDGKQGEYHLCGRCLEDLESKMGLTLGETDES